MTEDMLNADPELGKCYRCPWIGWMDELTAHQEDVRGGEIFLCPDCQEQEATR